MQYSAILIAAFAATALAAPADQIKSTDVTVTDGTDATVTDDYPETGDYPADNTDNTDNTHYDDSDNTHYDDGENYQPIDTSYDGYKTVEKSCYKPGHKDEYQQEYGSDMYFANDSAYVAKYEQYEVTDHISYPEQIDTYKKCKFSFKPKHSEYKGKYKMAVCKSTDGYKNCEPICEGYDCEYQFPDTYVPSDDSKNGCMHKLKVYEADNEENCSYSEDFPIYNPEYYVKNKDCTPAPKKCPPPKYVIKKPDTTPVTPVKPVAPVTPPVDSPVQPEQPSYAPSNNTAPSSESVQSVSMSAGTSIRASFSALVGIAAVVAFVL